MEIFELRYFLGVAKFENIHKASDELRISPAALSKAITRIESELQVKLFERQGRNIHLTHHGRLLKIRGSQIVQLEEAARAELSGQKGSLHITLAGPELLLSKFGMDLCAKLKLRHPLATFEFHAGSEKKALDEVREGESHFAIITQEAPQGVLSKTLGETSFVTVVGRGHPLFKNAQAGKTVSIEEVLQHGFVSPNNPLLGQVGIHQSLDGWRDDKFQRKIEFLSSSLKLIEELISTGKALAYLPDYFVKESKRELSILKVKGCPYTCQQKIKLITRSPIDSGWIRQVF